EGSHLVAAGGDHAALAGLPADDHGLAEERGIEQAFYGHEKRVQIEATQPRRVAGHIYTNVQCSGCDVNGLFSPAKRGRAGGPSSWLSVSRYAGVRGHH